ncbi:MAG: DNA repair protein RecO [Clostridiales bacterium]|nr:DNA repair protein RecO [Clostridiales bacterium]
MDGIKLNALCVKAVDYKDNKTLLTLCTVEKGKISAAITGCKSAKSKLRFAASLLCFGEYILSERGGFFTVTNCALTDGFYEVRGDIDKLYSALAVIELLDKTTAEHTDISDYVYLALDALKNIAYKDTPLFFLLKYLADLSELSGYSVDLNNCLNCGSPAYPRYFDISLGGGVCLECLSHNSADIGETVFKLLHDIIYTKTADIPPKPYIIEGISILYGYFSAYNEIKINAINQLLVLNGNGGQEYV